MKISHTLEIFSENCWSVLLEKRKENITILRRNNHFIYPSWLTPKDSPCQQIWKCRTGSSIESDLNQICRACITSARINFCSNSGTSVTILWVYNVHKINKHFSFRRSTLLPYYVKQVGSTPKYLGTKPARGTLNTCVSEMEVGKGAEKKHQCMTMFQLILQFANHNVTKNLTGHRMPVAGP